jgi:hypothetical protein
MSSGSRSVLSHQLQFGFCYCSNHTTINCSSGSNIHTKQVLQLSSPFIIRPRCLSASFSAKRFRFLLTNNYSGSSSGNNNGGSDDLRVSSMNCVQPAQSPALSDCLK